MSAPLLQVNNLQVTFINGEASTVAVKGISFSANAGELVAIVGESGSGKSLTSLSLLQLLPEKAQVSGEVLFIRKGAESINLLQLNKKSVQQLRGNDIAMIFQEPMTSLNPVHTCGNQVMEAIQLHQKLTKRAARQRVLQLFEKVQLPDPRQLMKRYPHQLSGGQKQRVMIAMAMSCNPSLLVADEPTTALDVTVQKRILQLIRELQQQNGTTVLLVTHDLGLVADIADRVIVMYRGEIVEQGNASGVLTAPRHEYTRSLLRCRPALHQKGERLPVIDGGAAGKHLPADNIIEEGSPGEAVAVNADTVLKVENLKVYYPGKKYLFRKSAEPYKAVDGVSFSVSKGEILGLVGESGCGKTTLGRAILQLVPATSGKILLYEKDIASLPPAKIKPLRKELQIVFQDPYGSLNPRITIGDAITEPMKVHGIESNNRQRKEKMKALLEKVNLLPDHSNRYPHQFSGGQRQRICIARALALEPSFLIFDESVSALDVSVQAQVLNLLNDLKKEYGFTAIFISHDLSVVRYICDRIMVMHRGKIIEEGEAEQIYTSPQHAYTQQLVDAIPGRKLFPGNIQ